MNEIKKCPFCGNKNTLIVNSDYGQYHAVCSARDGGCGASSGYFESKEEAAEAWNKEHKGAR